MPGRMYGGSTSRTGEPRPPLSCAQGPDGLSTARSTAALVARCLRGGHCSASAVGSTTPCGPASMHVCTVTGNDPEGNTCFRRNCSFEAPLGTEFPANHFFGGRSSSDTTAGAVCCPRALLAGGSSSGLMSEVEPVEVEPAPDPAAAQRLRTDARASLERTIAGLESQLDEARRAARWPETCSKPEEYELHPKVADGTRKPCCRKRSGSGFVSDVAAAMKPPLRSSGSSPISGNRSG